MASEDSLHVYWGGFLLNGCTPLELTLNRCGHSCNYCFANLNKPDRVTNAKQVSSLLSQLWQTDDKGQWKRKTYAAHLLREGYAVCISNHVDPLAGNNAYQALQYIEIMRGMNIPLNLMTRLGKPSDTQALFDLISGTPTPIYCSIPTFNADIARKAEPGAPLPEQRLEYLKQAISQGHPVSVGINPVIEGWIDDPVDMVKRLVDAGIKNITLGKIHLSRRQTDLMSDRELKNLNIVPTATGYKATAELENLYKAVEIACESAGVEIYTSQQGRFSRFWEQETSACKKSFPMMQEFVNLCHELLEPGDYIFWSDFRDFFVPKLPKGIFGLREHLRAIRRAEALYTLGIPQQMSYEKLLYYCWRHPDTIYCPANIDCFAYAGDRIPGTKNRWIEILDDDKLPIIVFQPEGTNGQVYTEDHDL